MNLSISFPYADGTHYDVATYNKEELMNELFDVWQSGYDLEQGVTELPKSIIDLGKFNTVLAKEARLTGIHLNQVEEDH